jgi:hypothetical protein
MLVFAAMTHDLGKFGEGTQIITREDGSIEKITSQGHPDLGMEPIQSFANRIGAPRSIVDPALKLVRDHMSHTAAGENEPSSRAVRNLVRRLGDGSDGATIRNWAILVDADQGGRGEASGKGTGWVWYEKAKAINNIVPPRLLVSGNLLKDLGLPPGEIFRNIINAGRIAQDDEIITDAESAEAWAIKHITDNNLRGLVVTSRINPRLKGA